MSSEIPKKKKKQYDNQYRIYCKLKMLILDEASQSINETNYMKVFVKCMRECFKLSMPYEDRKNITMKIMRQLVKEYGDMGFLLTDSHIISLIEEMSVNKFIKGGGCVVL